MALIKQKFGCEMMIPNNINGRKVGEDFIWISDYNNPSKVEMMSFAIYSYPYTSPDNFSREHFIHKRDSVMKENIQGAESWQYIQTDEETVTIEPVSFNGRYMSIARGSWYMENDDMFGGGPFVSHAFYSQDGQDVIVLQAFVYAPKYDKRQYLRQVESIIYSFEWAENGKEEQKD